MNSRSERASDFAYALLAAGVFAIYLAIHAYRGIQSDALIYVTPEWAPGAILRGDMLFANETQTRLTLFGAAFRPLLALLPVDAAAKVMALAGISLWFCGLLLLAHALAQAMKADRFAALLMAALVAFAPLNYSSGAYFIPGETLAVPRPFAEAFALMCFAAALRGKWVAAGAALVVSALWHPLMALAGGLVFCAYLALVDRRWIAVFAAGALAVTAAGLAEAPFISDLFRSPSPDWLALLREHTPYLFVSSGPASFWVDLALRCAILVAAARLSSGAARRFLIAVLLGSVAGLALAFLFSDAFVSLLVMRLQPWRALFVLAVVAPMAVGILAARLGEGDRAARLLLALVACAYAGRDAGWASLLFTCAVFAVSLRPSLAGALPPRLEQLLWFSAALMWGASEMLQFGRLVAILAAAPSGAFHVTHLWALQPFALPLGALSAWLFLHGPAPKPAMAAAFALAAATLLLVCFDDRSLGDRAIERGEGAMAAALPAGDATVLWFGTGKETWYIAKRPNWAAPIQASSIVFSRELTEKWLERTRFLVATGLEPPEILRNEHAGLDWRRDLSPEKIDAVCARPDAPAAIVAPLEEGDAAPVGARITPAPVPIFDARFGAEVRFAKTVAYAIFACAPAS